MAVAYVLIFIWLNPGVAKVEERSTYDTLEACQAAKERKIAEKIVPDAGGKLHSRTLHAECRAY